MAASDLSSLAIGFDSKVVGVSVISLIEMNSTCQQLNCGMCFQLKIVLVRSQFE